jgi:hypothetical protein
LSNIRKIKRISSPFSYTIKNLNVFSSLMLEITVPHMYDFSPTSFKIALLFHEYGQDLFLFSIPMSVRIGEVKT